MANFADIDLKDRSAVERLLEEATRQARQAWKDAASTTQSIAETRPAAESAGLYAPETDSALGALEQFITRANETNVALLTDHARLVESFFVTASDAYRLFFEATQLHRQTDFRGLFEQLARFEAASRVIRATVESRSDDLDTTIPPAKRRAAG